MSVTVANSAGFAPGQFVKLDEDDYTTATWMPMPARTGGNEPEVLATDRLVWKIHRPRGARDMPLPAGLSWFSRAGRPLAEIKEVVAVDGNGHHVLYADTHYLYDREGRAARAVCRLRGRRRFATSASRT